MTKHKLPIKLGVEQSIAGEKDVNRISCVRPELGEFATLFIASGIGLNAVTILIDMAKWTWEALMRTETTLKTESLPLRFRPCYKSGWRKIKAPSGTRRSYLRQLAYDGRRLAVVWALRLILKF